MIFFWLKEAVKLIGRAKSSFFLSLISTSISVFLIAASIISIQISNELQRKITNNVNINVFIKDTLTSRDIIQLQSKLKNKKYLNSIKYIDKDQAAKNFIKETGEDFRKILDYNPLPASFLITLNEGYVERDSLNKIVASISKLPGIDEVVFQQEFVYKLLSYINKFKKYIFVVTAILFFISIYIVFSTVKLITKSKYEELETMKLVGAKLSTIKMPIVLNGIFIGLLSSIISLTVFYLLIYNFSNLIEFQTYFNFNLQIYIILILCIGPTIGGFVSIFSLRKISLKV